MKKLYNLLAVMMLCVVTFGVQSAMAQAPVFTEDFTAVTGSGTQQCEASSSAITDINSVLPGWSGDKVYPANGKVKLGTGSANGWIETPSIDLSAYGTVRIVFNAKAWNVNSNPTVGTTMTVYVNSTAYTVEGLPNVGSTDVTTEGFCDMGEFEILAAAGAPTIIRFEASPRAFIDNIAIYPATGAAISVLGNTTFENIGVNETVNTILTAKGFNLTAGGTTTISISGDSQFTTTTTSASNDALMSTAGVAIPVSFASAEAGTFAATISLTNSDMANPTTVSLSANVIDIQDIPSIDQLRSLIDNSDIYANVTDSVFYRYTGHAYISQTFNPGSYSKWMQDETGAVQLYDPENHLTNVSCGQEVTNVIGKMCNYFGYVEMNVQAGISNADVNAFPTNIPEPIVVTIEQLQDQTYMDGIQGQLIKLENVVINGTGTFAKGRYTVSQNGATDTSICVSGQYDTQYGNEIPTGAVDIVGVNTRTAWVLSGSGASAVRADSRYYIVPRDIVAHGTGIANNEMETVKVYPNPFEDNFVVEATENATNVAVYNAFGQMVASQSVRSGANTINTENLAAGMYIVKVYNDNQVVGYAKVVKK